LPGPLIAADALRLQLDEGAGGAPTVLDVRWTLAGGPGREDYDAGHVPTAAFVDLDAELAGAPGPGGRHPLPAKDAFEQSMRRAGVSTTKPVVVYDAGPGIAAARAWWLLRYFGHPDVTVLDGGFEAWQVAGYPCEPGAQTPPAGDFVAIPGGMPVLDAATAAALATDGTLLDARAPERFRGEQEPTDPVAGHIPGARNLPSSRVIDAQGHLLAPERLVALLADAPQPLGAYCGSGISAAQLVLAGELIGAPVALYPGSWSEWVSDPRRPVQVGSSAAPAGGP
jgi:thiosulfate/3-mercaptopyruvate sulfurtransferase